MFNPKTVPVFRIGKCRGGRYFKRINHTIGQRRDAQHEIGEPPPRPKRNLNNIPSTWDDLPACWQRTWKVFGKRRKAWDR